MSEADTRSIFLVGPMGSGKSAVGRRLARDLRREFHDSDAFIEQRTGVEISYIFDKEGEAGFRKRETEALEELTHLEGIVLATGGGAVLAPQNRAVLAARGRVVYLQASVEQQYERTRRSRDRPLLQAGNRMQILTELMQIRDPLYREVAEVCVETDGCIVSSVIAQVRRQLAIPAD
jgi:shikimate kinase